MYSHLLTPGFSVWDASRVSAVEQASERLPQPSRSAPPAQRHRSSTHGIRPVEAQARAGGYRNSRDRKSTRLNSSHLVISYAVFCLKKKKYIVVQSPHRVY